MADGLTIVDLTVKRSDKLMFEKFSLSLQPGELVALTGPNGVGKSSLALTIMGHPSCMVVEGTIKLDETDLLTLKTHERARLGLFLAHQEPPAIPGVTVANALHTMSELVRPNLTTAQFFDELRAGLQRLDLPESFGDRPLHANFSGGEKKRAELLSLLILKPKYAILDEIDAGLDATARALTIHILAELRSAGTGLLIITHNDNWLKDLQPSQEYHLG